MHSMTGFGKGETEGETYQITVELKSVNHRFKDMRFRMGSIFNSQELTLRKKIEKHFKRGSFDISVHYKKRENLNQFDHLDKEKVKAFIGMMRELCDSQNAQLNVSPSEFMRSEFYLDESETKENELLKILEGSFNMAIEELQESRKTEGEQLRKILEGHLSEYEQCFKSVKAKAPEFEKDIREKILKKFQEYKEEIGEGENRFAQEVIYYLEKVDIHEEINRIDSHIKTLRDLLKKNSEVGRKIDFLVQELNRETNTIGSKSSVTEVSDNVIQMKTFLEKIREQALNLE